MTGEPSQPTLRLRNATLADCSVVDVTVDGGSGRIVSVDPVAPGPAAPVDPAGPASTSPAEPASLSPAEPGHGPDPAVETIDLTGHVLLPAPAEPHAHLDKALTVDRVPNPDGDLGGAIAAWLSYRPTIEIADYVERATAAARIGLANGCTAIRTHVDIGPDIGTRGVEALLEVKADLEPLLDLQLVGLIFGVAGPAGAPPDAEAIALLRDALDLGLDVVGGVPHIEAYPERAVDVLLEVAGEYGRPIDLHADENLDPSSADLETLASRVAATGFEYGATASHCVALGMAEPGPQSRVGKLAAEAGVSVVTLPQTNLYLQAREQETAQPRGLTAIGPLMREGVNVAGGGDNLRDPFCPVGRADPLETASLLVMAGHLSPADAYRAVSDNARRAIGQPPVAIEPGSPAELVAIPATSITEAVAAAPNGRTVIHRGRIVST